MIVQQTHWRIQMNCHHVVIVIITTRLLLLLSSFLILLLKCLLSIPLTCLKLEKTFWCYAEERHSIGFRIPDRTRSNTNVSSPPEVWAFEEVCACGDFSHQTENKEWLVVIPVDPFCPLLYNTCVNINSVTVTTLCYGNNIIKYKSIEREYKDYFKKKPSVWVH